MISAGRQRRAPVPLTVQATARFIAADVHASCLHISYTRSYTKSAGNLTAVVHGGGDLPRHAVLARCTYMHHPRMHMCLWQPIHGSFFCHVCTAADVLTGTPIVHKTGMTCAEAHKPRSRLALHQNVYRMYISIACFYEHAPPRKSVAFAMQACTRALKLGLSWHTTTAPLRALECTAHEE